MSSETDIIFFDGECGFCDTAVRRIMQIDRKRHLRFAPLQGETANRLLSEELRNPENLKTLVYLDVSQKVWTKSEATIEILKRVGGFWKVAALAKILPVGFRDWFYDRVAERRRSIIDKANCPLPTADQRARILP
ncbi:MAG: thiol-disulfide oxidoreductase [Opitutaceae bacterium]|nr:thiol-disulfide oxidoreductase [Opitutaceae bacterium]